MMEFNEDKVNNEYYLAPTYNYMIKNGDVIKSHLIGKIAEDVHGLGTPEDFKLFLSKQISMDHAQSIKERLKI